MTSGIARLGVQLSRNLWLIPLGFALVLGIVALTASEALETAMREQLRTKLQTLLEAEASALRLWVSKQKAIVASWAHDPRIRKDVSELERIAREAEEPRAALLASPAQERLRVAARRITEHHGFSAYTVIERGGIVLADTTDQRVGTREGPLAGTQALVDEAPAVLPPARGPHSMDAEIRMTAPVRATDGGVIALLRFSEPPAADFSRILNLAQLGRTGETYALDANGLMISRSRFDEQLRELGLLPVEPGITSFMQIEIRDPGGDLREGHVPDRPPRGWPLTRMAASALEGETGSDVDGYRDYRGVMVAGAWTWIPELRIGLATEIDIDEAYGPLFAMRARMRLLVGVLALAGLAIFLYSFFVQRLRRQVEEARRLGRYTIERKIRSGGMGTVYLARHALLRRPTAVKVLHARSAGAESVARFEREVQVSSCLTHPNTIQIYDYGLTPDGTFYYAMEYLNGAPLSECIEEDGSQPEARVVHILKQVCASLAEAHSAGLIHRDVKPSNLMLCTLGGILDFVKVLDFGLVRPQQQSSDLALTDTSAVTGTPLYMSPEAIQSPENIDVRSDLYQLGAVGFCAVDGRPVFAGDSAVEVLAQHINSVVRPPSDALGRAVSPDLEKIIMRCLEKDPSDRFAHAAELLTALESCSVSGQWSQRDAVAWWARWNERHPEAPDSGIVSESGGSLPSGYSVDLAERLHR